MTMLRIVVFLSVSLAYLSLPPPPPAAAAASAPCAGEGTTSPFCGSSCCCSAKDDLKLREAFLAEVKAHGYEDDACRSQLKAYICAVCLSAFNNDPPSALPLPCAADTHTKEASTSAASLLKWIFGVIGSLITILGSYGAYKHKHRTCSCFNRTTNVTVNATDVNIHSGEIQLTEISTEG